MILEKLKIDLYKLRDEDYIDFQIKLIPNIDRSRIIGVRIPDLKKLVNDYYKLDKSWIDAFMEDLPHEFLEGEHIHMFLMVKEKDPKIALKKLDRLLPTISNWASCDNRAPKCLEKDSDLTLAYIDKWLNSDYTYQVRYAIKLLKDNYLKDRFQEKYLTRVGAINSGQYYIQMMVAWYFAEALIYQWDLAKDYLEEGLMEVKTHNQAIQKAIDSRRISDSKKTYLKTLRRPGGILIR